MPASGQAKRPSPKRAATSRSTAFPTSASPRETAGSTPPGPLPSLSPRSTPRSRPTDGGARRLGRRLLTSHCLRRSAESSSQFLGRHRRASSSDVSRVVPHSTGQSRPTTGSKCSNYWGQHQQTLPEFEGETSFNTYICGYIPRQLRKAYHTNNTVKGGTTGDGVTVAIIDAYGSPTMESDANQYSALVGEPTFGPGQYTETLFKPFNMRHACGGEAGWNGEQTLDVEAVHGMAPGADIYYLGAKNCDAGIDDAFNYAVQNHVADIISNSYGYQGEDVPPAQRDLEHSMFLQAGLEGIGAYFSSGDDGDNVINGLTPQPDLSSSDPLVTGVGGTSLLLGQHAKRFQETGWETSAELRRLHRRRRSLRGTRSRRVHFRCWWRY